METKYLRKLCAAAVNDEIQSVEDRAGALEEVLDIAVALIDGLGRLASAIEGMNQPEHFGDL